MIDPTFRLNLPSQPYKVSEEILLDSKRSIRNAQIFLNELFLFLMFFQTITPRHIIATSALFTHNFCFTTTYVVTRFQMRGTHSRILNICLYESLIYVYILNIYAICFIFTFYFQSPKALLSSEHKL